MCNTNRFLFTICSVFLVPHCIRFCSVFTAEKTLTDMKDWCTKIPSTAPSSMRPYCPCLWFYSEANLGCSMLQHLPYYRNIPQCLQGRIQFLTEETYAGTQSNSGPIGQAMHCCTSPCIWSSHYRMEMTLKYTNSIFCTCYCRRHQTMWNDMYCKTRRNYLECKNITSRIQNNRHSKPMMSCAQLCIQGRSHSLDMQKCAVENIIYKYLTMLLIRKSTAEGMAERHSYIRTRSGQVWAEHVK